jgi:hypothetical protein
MSLDSGKPCLPTTVPLALFVIIHINLGYLSGNFTTSLRMDLGTPILLYLIHDHPSLLSVVTSHLDSSKPCLVEPYPPRLPVSSF